MPFITIDNFLLSGWKRNSSRKNHDCTTESDKEICQSKNETLCDNDNSEKDCNSTETAAEIHKDNVEDNEKLEKSLDIYHVKLNEHDDVRSDVNTDGKKSSYVNVAFYRTLDDEPKINSSGKNYYQSCR